jgi:hypothetical protein
MHATLDHQRVGVTTGDGEDLRWNGPECITSATNPDADPGSTTRSADRPRRRRSDVQVTRQVADEAAGSGNAICSFERSN